MIHTPPQEKPTPGPAYLARTRYLDHDAPKVRALAERFTAGASTPMEKAVKLFYGVRDGWRYDPFAIRLYPDAYVASKVIDWPGLYCIPKAILLAALARAVSIPCGIGLSDVVNHLTTEKLKSRMGGKTLFIHHGYAVMYLEGAWVKAAPAFNIELCTRFGVLPTDFDGKTDAIFQPYDAQDRRHMEYVKDHGIWSDFPYDKVEQDFRAFYPASTFGENDAGELFEDGVRIH